MPSLLEILIAAAMILGTFLILIASIGLVRLPDVYCRIHAAGKAGTMGISLIVLSTVFFFWSTDPAVVVRGLLAIFFQFLTAPVAVHLLARASYVTDYPLSERTAVDELQQFMLSRPDEMYGAE